MFFGSSGNSKEDSNANSGKDNNEEKDNCFEHPSSTVINEHSLFTTIQAQEKREQLYSFAYYSALTKLGFWKICRQFSKGDGDHWANKDVKFHKHPLRFLERHYKQVCNGVVRTN